MTTAVLIEPAARAALAAAGLVDFDDFMLHAPVGPAVSRHRHRETVPLMLAMDGAPRRFFLKRVFRVQPKHWWEDWRCVRTARSQPWREWDRLAELQTAGIGVMQRVAVGERRAWGRPCAAFLLVRAIEADATAAELLQHDSPRRLARGTSPRTALFRELGRLFGRMTRAGFVWPDAQPRHVFARHDAAAHTGWSLAIIDVERVTRRAPRAADLLRLLRRLLPCEPSRTEQSEFVAGLRAEWPDAPHDAGVALPWLSSHDGLEPIAAPPDGLPATALNGGDGFWMNAHDAAALAEAGLSSASALLGCDAGDLLAKPGLDAHRRRRRLTLHNGRDGRTLYLKQIERPPLAEQFRRVAHAPPGDSTAWREWHFIRRLTEIGVPTMRCVAVAHEMAGPIERRSALLTSEVPGEALERWLPREGHRLSRRRRTALIAQVAAAARLLHAAGLYHRDFYLAHLFVSWPTEDQPLVHVIDLARMLERPLMARRYRIKDLAALNYSAPPELVSRTDRLRFLRRYWPGFDAPARRAVRRRAYRVLIAAVEARTRRMRRHDVRRGRA